MTVKAYKRGGIYHHRVRADGTTDEHVSQTPIRRTPTAYVLYCAPCDSISVVLRSVDSEEKRNVERMLRGSYPVTDLSDVKDETDRPTYSQFDPLAMAREDGETRVPDILPLGHDERRELARSLRG